MNHPHICDRSSPAPSRCSGFFFYFIFRPCHVTRRILVPQPGNKSGPPALGAWSLKPLDHQGSQARILEWVAFPFPRIFPTQELNPSLLHCRRILYQLSHKGNPRILECPFFYPFSSGYSRARNLLHCRQILYHM